jgi:hypothetical protein
MISDLVGPVKVKERGLVAVTVLEMGERTLHEGLLVL